MALYRALEEHDVAVLLSMVSKSDDSYMYHVPNIHLTRYAAEAIGIPLISRETSGKPPQENIDLKDALEDIKREYKIDGLCVGAVHSNYQYKIVSDACSKLNLRIYAPYWQRSHDELIMDAINAGFEIIIVSVAAEGLTEEWLGRRLDGASVEELRILNENYGIDIGGEGGEYETLVLDGPIFGKRICIVKSEKRWEKIRGEMVIKEVKLEEK